MASSSDQAKQPLDSQGEDFDIGDDLPEDGTKCSVPATIAGILAFPVVCLASWFVVNVRGFLPFPLDRANPKPEHVLWYSEAINIFGRA